jgi:D-alanine transaminase
LRVVKQEEVQAADEILMSSATREVLAIVQLDGKPVGAGKPGPVFQKLRAAYDARIAAL